MRLPVLGLADVNINPFYFALGVIGNDDSLNNLEFFFKIIEETTKEGRQEEQELFFHLIFYELSKILNHETIL
jgi:ribosomal protein S2